MVVLVMFLVLLTLLAINVPIAIALAVTTIIAMVSANGTNFLIDAAIVMFDGSMNFPLIAIPLFILAGAIMNTSGISRRLINFASALVGFVRGGLSMVNIATSMFFAEISGSAVADVAALGSILIPAMKKKGYTGAFAAAVTSSSASLAVIIPPSIPMILYAVMAQTSVVQLFVAGIIPGIIGGFGLMFVSYIYAIRKKLPIEETFNLSNLRRTGKEASLAFVLPVIILGGIFGGFVTATEGAGLAVVAACIIGAVYRELNFKQFFDATIEGASSTAIVMLLVAASVLIGEFLTIEQVPQTVATSITGFTDNKFVILAILNVFLLIIGLFLHSAAAIIVVVPIVMPLVATAGIDPVHFGIIVTLNLAIGQQTPPVASVLVTACSVAKADIWEVSKINVMFVAVLFAVLLLVTYVPFVPMGLVEHFYR
ncbi:TRAP-type C4-dicarboxylate transport system, large permease component [Candidatus Pelagibacter sp. IMCC9063]|jgi:tripartite ATP-independent transporter DctM subunit|uniref:TRAP transporter large permease n=1 Tax=Pelagibacter sp. (strain IMCC9063) TaxID=1002672 RepID=UPI0002046426|nr:TRAP transporter large permease [Candidatus Pelagibacter sp. IMCC9063]AEA81771.1 TRAP-type C4-dicarboxylate transport system, large permease component [Candidatus Pelagibacter sp. IMCC9063]|tara:strand:+ start:299 stop:1579 length:1281 start_codon:yes stop_codon:yes gene_type:complete